MRSKRVSGDDVSGVAGGAVGGQAGSPLRGVAGGPSEAALLDDLVRDFRRGNALLIAKEQVPSPVDFARLRMAVNGRVAGLGGVRPSLGPTIRWLAPGLAIASIAVAIRWSTAAAPTPTARPTAPTAPAPLAAAPPSPTATATAAPTPRWSPPASASPLTRPAPRPLRAHVAAPLPAALPEPADETAAVAQIFVRLNGQRDIPAALAAIAEYRRAFPGGQLRAEVDAAEVAADLAVGRRTQALALLDTLNRQGIPRTAQGNGLQALRAELLEKAGRCREALPVWDGLLAGEHRSTSLSADLAGRALFGRAACRATVGDAAGAGADLSGYLERFPSGPFAAEARARLE